MSEVSESPSEDIAVAQAKAWQTIPSNWRVELVVAALLILGLALNIRGSIDASNGYSNDRSLGCFAPITGSFESQENFNTQGTGGFDGNSTEGTTLSGMTYDECISAMYSGQAAVSSGRALETRGARLAQFSALVLIALGVRRFLGRKNDADLVSMSSRDSSDDLDDRLSQLTDLLASNKISHEEYVEARLRILSE
jgi:hypothetical protein